MSFPSFSQTKVETENWIKSKFIKWKVTDNRIEYSNGIDGFVTGGSTEKPISLSFINCSLIFKTEYNNLFSSASKGNNSYSLNIGDIENVEWINSKLNNTTNLVIVTKKSLVKVTNIDQNGSDTSYIDRCVIAFNTEGEENFKERMLKAVNHLRSFCPKPIKNKEAF